MVILSIGGVFVSTMVRERARPLPVYGEVIDFRLTNQLGQAVSKADLKGRVWVADIIFTRCSGPCLAMTRTMKSIEAALRSETSVGLLSLTADPGFDTPAVLQKYAGRFDAACGRWQFLTGPKSDLYDLAVRGLKLAVQENTDANPAEDNQFIHSTRLVLIDRNGKLRGLSFDGTEKQVIPDVLRAVEKLLRES
jgi:protein SCO1/2